MPSLNTAFFQRSGMIVRALDVGAKENDIELLECMCVCDRELDRDRSGICYSWLSQ